MDPAPLPAHRQPGRHSPAGSATDTSPSLLERVRTPGDRAAWGRFVDLYTPLLYRWARGLGAFDPEAADLTQDVLTTLVRALPRFEYDRSRSFRGWLRTVLTNRWREFRRRRDAAAGGDAADMSDPAGPDPADALADAEYQRYLVGRALQLMRAEFEPTTWRACWECVAAGRPAAEVAAGLGTSVDAVYAAKSRVLRRLREELAGLLE